MNKCLICDKKMTVFRDCGGGVSIYCGEHGTPLEQTQKTSAIITELERTVDELRGELAQSDRVADKMRIAELEEILVEILENAVVNGVYREKAKIILDKKAIDK